jgi:hypothetical protein
MAAGWDQGKQRRNSAREFQYRIKTMQNEKCKMKNAK